MKMWQTSGPPTQDESRWTRWAKWLALVLIVVGVALWIKGWWMPESDDMRRFKADWHTCRVSDSAEVQLRACTRLIESGWVAERSLPDTFNNRGVAYWRLDKFEQALRDYDQAIKLNPQHDSAFLNRGNSYVYLKKLDLAIADYTRALEINPKDDSAYMNRGHAYSEKGDFKNAILSYDQAIKLQPDKAGLLVARGYTWRSLGENAKAEADFAAARAIDPKIDIK